jgi:hypothetical protein
MDVLPNSREMRIGLTIGIAKPWTVRRNPPADLSWMLTNDSENDVESRATTEKLTVEKSRVWR